MPIATLRDGLTNGAYGTPVDLKLLGRDLQKLLVALGRVPHPTARQCTADLTDAYNAVAKARMARRGR